MELGAPVVELHTGRYCELDIAGELGMRDAECERIAIAAAHGFSRGLEVHAGHGLTFESVGPIAAIPELAELNIGHFLIGEAIFTGLEAAIRKMRNLMERARAQATVEPA